MMDHTVLLQQLINGISLGSLYALLALGFTLVYGIIELVNFAHFSVFMVGSFVAMAVLEGFGLSGQTQILYGLPLLGVLAATLVVTMLATGLLGVAIERLTIRPLRGVSGTTGMITTIGVSYILANLVRLTIGTGTFNYPNPLQNIRWQIGGATIDLRQTLLVGIAVALMIGLQLFVTRTRVGKAMKATAQDTDAARMMGVDINKVVVLAFFLAAALAGAAGLIFGLFYSFTNFLIGYSTGLRAFTAAVIGGIGSVPGAMLGGLAIGIIEAMSSHFLSAEWADVVIFAILILTLVIFPSGLLGDAAPSKS